MEIRQPDYSWNGNLTPRNSTVAIVLHHAAAENATAEGIHNYHKNSLGWLGIAYHFFVDKEGGVTAGRPLKMQGGHTMNHNHNTIGICFEGNFEVEQMNEIQIQAGREIIAYIKNIYGDLPLYQHKDYPDQATACAGKYFPIDEIKKDSPVILLDTPSEWARISWDKAVTKGIFDGTDPQGNFTREQAAVTYDRLGLLD